MTGAWQACECSAGIDWRDQSQETAILQTIVHARLHAQVGGQPCDDGGLVVVDLPVRHVGVEAADLVRQAPAGIGACVGALDAWQYGMQRCRLVHMQPCAPASLSTAMVCTEAQSECAWHFVACTHVVKFHYANKRGRCVWLQQRPAQRSAKLHACVHACIAADLHSQVEQMMSDHPAS